MNYLSHFGLSKAPFAVTPDPSFAYATSEHEQALLKIAYYTDERQGLFLLIGEIGTGKTTISKLAVNGWRTQPDKYTVGQIADPSPPTQAAFLRLVLASFMQPVMRNVQDLKTALGVFLFEEHRAGRTVILVIDEAQTIHPQNLDAIHALTNEQTQTEKLIQILFLAQPNFRNKLAQKPAIASRIAGAHTLDPLTWEDSIGLLRHRMKVAGGDFDAVFPVSTHKLLYNATHGVPRDLCILCNASLLNAFSAKKKTVTEAMITDAQQDLDFKRFVREAHSPVK
jgi:general secretion pathway protein A